MDQKLATFGDTVTWTKGKHSIKAAATSFAIRLLMGLLLTETILAELLT